MFKQLMTAGALAFVMATPVAFAQPAEADPLAKAFWTERNYSRMDKNKDGMVSRQEFLDYMGAQFDRMDAKRKGMLTKTEFMDSKMMASTFPAKGD